ncbi:hypothetical protein [Serratia plymuthica]|uniref:Uncharacterized protein n=1 Tax=Serratia plymuthica TaxID=82996 RepID=A0A2X4X7U3_SERPL|nr:hypothetical protein [Serratia plymuthica]QPS22242.1 hypothetical protein I6G64_07585 [Serratia plymuthica]QPS55145.1 hypothetical protein I6G53_21275 [Serratia plymuthica]QPS63853.1 hypothetical protein I6G52_03375 [Serratia plymuthica]RKS63762.1 hypothetical protein C8E17_3045 [Serratia plymuthica]CAI1927319.1 Uncharacterised protein [Serratia plymuthica]
MSKRNEIIDGSQAATARGGLIYTEVLGWVDLGHARGDDVRILMNKIDRGEAMKAERYDVTYAQSMVSPKQILRVGKFITWRIRKGRPYHERKSIALAMMMTLARRFETFQATFPNNMVTDSGFSGEDLVSDLLGFYRVMSIQNPFSRLRPVSKEEALKRWDYYGKIGSWKNETFQPLLFPDPERFPNARPRLGQLPNFMKTLQPYNDWKSGNVAIATVDGSFIQNGKKRDLIV